MTIRLNKVTRDLNVGITTVVEFLQKKGYTIEASPNAKITEEQYAVLVKEFSTDKNLKIESEKFSQERQNKDRNKASISIEGFESKKEKEEVVKTVIPEEARPKLKQVGKIDLDNLNKKTAPKVVEPVAKVIEQTPKAEPVVEKVVERKETPQPEKETPKPVVVEEKKPEPAPQPAPAPVLEEKKEPKIEKTEEKTPQVKEMEKETPEAAPVQEKEEDDVFKIRPTEFKSKINVVGQIDLAALNQSTRPKKKSKEEKRKEREEKDKQRQEQRKLMKDAIIKEIRKGDDKISKNSVNDDAAKKKKRNRINKERVDINAAGTTNAGGASNNNQRNDNANRPNRNNNSKPNGNNNQGGGKFNKDRFKKPVVKAEVSDEDVAKQVKETLARLTNKTKNKAAKYRKEKRENVQNRLMEQEEMEQEDSKILKLTEFVTANELASMMDIPVTQVIATCMSIGIMVSINQRLDAETINLVAEEFGYKTEYVSAEVAQAITEEEDNEEDLQPRAPIVTVMGHVDHGKTSLLDYIRKANVIAGEAGGITQHIGAYNVKLEDGRHITFLDTPGHEAFTAMRARGAKVTDIAIIIVAADDNVMPQTKEAINHAMAAGVPIVFAINKVDKPHANPDKIKEELAAMNFLVEEWGGKYQSQDISAKKGTGVHDLLEKVLLEAEMLDLKANPDRKATGSIIESSLDKGRGYVATMLVANGTLKMGDIVLAGTSYGKVKAMFKFNMYEWGDITCIEQADEDRLWLGTNDHGILLWNRSTGKAEPFWRDAEGQLPNPVVSMLKSKDGKLWVGTFNGGLYCMNGSQVRSYKEGTGNALASNNVWALVEDDKGRIWIASLGGGLQCLEPLSGTFETYTSNNSALLENNVTSLCWVDDNTLFFGTASQGVGTMDMRTREIKKIQGQSGSMKLSNDAVNHVYKDSRGLVWIATREGLNVYDTRRHMFLDLSPVAEAKGNFIAAITEDQERNMWVSTSRKVIRVTVASDGKGSYLFDSRAYNSEDGLQNCDFNQRSIKTLHNGIIAIGGLYGVNVFAPDHIRYNKMLPNVMFTGLSLFDEAVKHFI